MSVQQELDHIRAEYGTGEDAKGLIGKTVRITDGEEPFCPDGATAQVVHVDAGGDVWADFGEPTFNGDQVWCLQMSEYEVVGA